MASLINMNYSTGYAEFSIDSESEISKLPTTKKAGTDELHDVNAVTAGSIARLSDGTYGMYVLNGDTDEWVLSDTGGGGGGSGGTTNYNVLSNKPQINGVTVSGSRSSAEYGIPSRVITAEELAAMWE